MYIKDSSCISPQNTFENKSFSGEIQKPNGDRYEALEPSYKELIPRSLLRRMGKISRMSVATALPLLEKYKTDGILVGVEGGFNDSDGFLDQIIEYNEGTLTPTNFVQSTSNSVAGILALMNKNTGYNITHTNGGLAFESAILDALMLFEEGKVTTLLLGAATEFSNYNYKIRQLKKQILEKGGPTYNKLIGEGTVFFIVDNNPDNALAQIVDVQQSTFPTKVKLSDDLNSFLVRNNLTIEDIDTVIVGNGAFEKTDHWYDYMIEEHFTKSSIYSYKHLVGSYGTANGFATWLGVQILQGNPIPKECIVQSKNESPKNILIYNHFEERQHGFILMSLP